jgi:N-methylhydantoinase A
MQTTDLMREHGITRIGLVESYSVESINNVLDGLEATLLDELSAEGVPRTATRVEWLLELRYSGHNYEVQVAIERLKGKEDLRRAVQRFHELHGQTFGHSAAGEPVEIVNLKVRAIGVIPKPNLRRYPFRDERPTNAALIGRRSAYFNSNESVTVSVYNRELLAAGNIVSGPAVIEELTSTTVVHPNHVARVDDLLNLVISAQ